MKFSDDVLLEIVDIVRRGIATGTDVSQMLRDLDLEESDGRLVMTAGYLEHREWSGMGR
jgi:hypothetical protein